MSPSSKTSPPGMTTWGSVARAEEVAVDGVWEAYRGRNVVDRDRQPIGVVEDVIDLSAGSLALLLVRTSLVGRPRLVPVAVAADSWPDVVLPYEAERVLRGPRCRFGRELGERDRQAVHRYYRTAWRVVDGGTGPGQPRRGWAA